MARTKQGGAVARRQAEATTAVRRQGGGVTGKRNGAPSADAAFRTAELLSEKERLVHAAAVDVGEEPPPAKDFTGAIYDAITKVFASRNPTQLFCLCWPGTTVDYERLAWTPEQEVGGNMPEDSLIRSSIVLDQYLPPAPITQPDGTRVSDRYGAALSMFGPRPNLELLQLQAIIRSRLRTQVTRDIDGQKRTFTLAAWFDYLYSQWTEARRIWGEKQLEMQEYFKQKYVDDPDREAWWNAYLQWYGDNADAYVARINGKWQQLVAEFPMAEWEDAISILDTHDNSGLEEARLVLQNATRPLPYQEGIEYVPSQGVPYDWPLSMKPVTKFLDLLADPEAQQLSLNNALAALEQEVFNWTAIVPQIADDEIKADADALGKARSAFSKAQSDLLITYGENTVTAVKMVADIMASRDKKLEDKDVPPEERPAIENDIKSTATDMGQAPKPGFNWEDIKKIADQFGAGQTTLIGKQQAMIDAGLALADAADKFLADKWNQSAYPWLRAYVQQLQTKLEAVIKQQANFASSSNVWAKYRETAPAGGDPNASPNFGDDAFPTPLDGPGNSRWTSVVVDVSTSQMKASSSSNTWFSANQWGLDLFLFSGGGSSQTSGAKFQSEFMKDETKIQIGFLATKVVIDRPWMRPELFQHTGNFFRTTKKAMSPDYQVTAGDLMGPGGNDLILKLINDYAFPCYPVAFLVVKDVTVKVQIKVDRMSDMREYAKSTKSQGGGFFCFSVSSSESSESQSESTNEYCMAGQFIARAPGPQIIGHWLQFMPADKSQVLDAAVASEIAQSLGFANKLQAVHTAGTESAAPPVG